MATLLVRNHLFYNQETTFRKFEPLSSKLKFAVQLASIATDTVPVKEECCNCRQLGSKNLFNSCSTLCCSTRAPPQKEELSSISRATGRAPP